MATRPSSVRSGEGRRIAVALAAVLVVFVGVFSPPSPAAAEQPPFEHSWGPTAGRVWDIVRIGNVVYLGGSFTQISNGSSTITRSRLAALDATTGEPLSSWDPSFDDEVIALAVSPDGLIVYAGGRFRNVDGQSRDRIVALDAASGEVISGWSPAASSTVRAIAATSATIYFGGDFGSVSGVSRSRLAAVAASTGALTSWTPTANARVTSLALEPSGGSVYLGGHFGSVNGTTRPKLARVNDVDGTLLSFSNNVEYRDVFDIYLGDKLYVASGGGGGKAWALDSSTGSTAWSIFVDGDAQAVGYHDDFVYFGGHFEWSGSGSQERLIQVTTSGGVTSWLPTFNSGPGIWAVEGAVDKMYVGGDFTQVNNTSALRLVAFGGDGPGGGGTPLIAAGAVWRFLDDGSDQGTLWTGGGFDDSLWGSGPAELGYGDTQVTTVASGAPGPKHVTTYFRHTFDASEAGFFTLDLSVLRDDGAVIYVNGVEVVRTNMPAGVIGYTTLAAGGAGGGESTFFPFTVPDVALAATGNVIAAEIHQVTTASSDISFNLTLTATLEGPPDLAAPTDPSALVATLVSPNGASLTWTGSTDDSGTVFYDIYRSDPVDDPTGSVIGTTTDPATNFVDSGLAFTRTFTYWVTARDPSTNTSAASNTAEVTTEDAPPGPVDLVLAGAVWRFLDDGSDQGTLWTGGGFDDSLWGSGPAELGYGDTQVTTVASGAPGPKHVTTYFRHTFDASEAGFFTLDLSVLRDDGAVIYVNGVEVVRTNMPAGVIGYTTLAAGGAGGGESTFFPFTVPDVALAATGNVIAAEIHQVTTASSDISFNLTLTATLEGPPDLAAPTDPSALVATLVSPNGASLTWTGSTDDSGTVFYDIYRSDPVDDPTGSVIGTTTDPATNFVDSGLAFTPHLHVLGDCPRPEHQHLCGFEHRRGDDRGCASWACRSGSGGGGVAVP